MRVEPLTDFLRGLERVAALDLAGVQELALLVAADIERCDPPGPRAKLLDKGDNWKGAAFLALYLNPGFDQAGVVRRIALLADDAFKSHAAAGLEHVGAVYLEMLGHKQRVVVADQLFKSTLALHQRHGAKIKTIQVE